MKSRPVANPASTAVLRLLEQRFGLRLSAVSAAHLREVREHYLGKRKRLLWEHGEAGALARPDYAKAVLISEAAALLLREIDPRPRRAPRRTKGSTDGQTG